MSILVDKLFVAAKSTQRNINGVWYAAKPIGYCTVPSFIARIKDAIRVIQGKSIAVHYREDEIKEVK